MGMGAYDEDDEQQHQKQDIDDENSVDIIDRQEGDISENSDEVTMEELMNNYKDFKD